MDQPSLTFNRLDVAFKLLYLSDHSIFHDMYFDHIKALSFGSFKEPGSTTKRTFDNFLEEFEDILKEMSSKGFQKSISTIPVATDGSILNGSHRTACAIHLNIPVVHVQTGKPPANYNHEFFRTRGVNIDYIDAAATKFVEMASNCHVAIVWPTAIGRDDELGRIFKRVVDRKEVLLNRNGAHNLLAQVYKDESWLGLATENYPGTTQKLNDCFRTTEPLRAFIFQADSIDDVNRIKSQVRDLFKKGKSSIHITDTWEEALRVTRALFNRHAVHFMNQSKPNKFGSTRVKLEQFRAFIRNNGGDPSNYVIDGGLIMAIYG